MAQKKVECLFYININYSIVALLLQISEICFSYGDRTFNLNKIV